MCGGLPPCHEGESQGRWRVSICQPLSWQARRARVQSNQGFLLSQGRRWPTELVDQRSFAWSSWSPRRCPLASASPGGLRACHVVDFYVHVYLSLQVNIGHRDFQDEKGNNQGLAPKHAARLSSPRSRCTTHCASSNIWKPLKASRGSSSHGITLWLALKYCRTRLASALTSKPALTGMSWLPDRTSGTSFSRAPSTEALRNIKRVLVPSTEDTIYPLASGANSASSSPTSWDSSGVSSSGAFRNSRSFAPAGRPRPSSMHPRS